MRAALLTGFKILVAETTSYERHRASALVRGAGASQVWTARGPNEAMHLARLACADAVVIGPELAIDGGIVFIRRLRDASGGLDACVPIAVLCKRALTEWVRAARGAGADQIVLLPVAADMLGLRILHMLARAGGAVGHGDRHTAVEATVTDADANPGLTLVH